MIEFWVVSGTKFWRRWTAKWRPKIAVLFWLPAIASLIRVQTILQKTTMDRRLQFWHIVLVYLPKNTTPFFQPLDQCIIWSFKASDRPKFARKVVHYFNKHLKASPQPDALEAIYLVSEALEELLQRVISHCWIKAGILPCLDKNYPDHTVKAFEEYMQHL